MSIRLRHIQVLVNTGDKSLLPLIEEISAMTDEQYEQLIRRG